MDRRNFLGLSGASVLGGYTALTAPDSEERTTGRTVEEDRARDAVFAKVDLHSHLRRGGGQAMADRYAELGFDALVGTDHSYDVGLPGHESAEDVEDYSDIEFPGPILDGVEASDDRHVNVIESETETIKQINHPMRYDLTAEDITPFADRIGADLVEVTNHAEELDQYPTVADVVRDLDLKPTITSDAHGVDAVGRGYVLVEVPELTGDEIVRSLRRGAYSIGGQLW